MQGCGQRRGLLPRDALGRGPAGGACARGGERRRGRLRPRPVGHRRAGDLSGAAGDGPRGGGRRHHRVRQLHDGDAEAPEPLLARAGRDGEHRRGRPTGDQRAARRRMQIRCGLARDAQPEGHLSEPARHLRPGRLAVHRSVRIRRARTRNGRRLHALARAAWTEPRENGDARGDPAPALAHEPARLLLRAAAHARGLPELSDGRVPVLPLRLRYPGAGRRRHRPHHRRPRAQS